LLNDAAAAIHSAQHPPYQHPPQSSGRGQGEREAHEVLLNTQPPSYL
jgi:hypothetical protein